MLKNFLFIQVIEKGIDYVLFKLGLDRLVDLANVRVSIGTQSLVNTLTMDPAWVIFDTFEYIV